MPDKKTPQSRIKSFGLIFTKFIAGGAALLESVSEVQVFFGDLNDKSLPGLNVASFPIDVGLFYEMYRQKIVEVNRELTVNEFFEVLKEQIEDIRSIPYGFRKYYKPYDVTKPTSAELGEGKGYGNKSVAEEAIRDFVIPSVGMIAVSGPSVDGTSTGTINDDLLVSYQSSFKNMRINGGSTASKKIMRIYVFDRLNNKSPMDFLTADGKRGVQESTNTQSLVTALDKYDSSLKKIAALLKQHASIVPATGDNVGKVNIEFNSSKEFKDFVSSLTSVIQVGGNSSMITSCNVETKMDKRLAASFMLKAAATNQPDQPHGAQVNNLPAYVIPAQLTINCFGCPLINYMQGFYVDFGTGTTLDNMYYVVSLNHTITPGKFVSSMKLSFNDISNGYRIPRELTDILQNTYQATQGNR